MLCEGAGSYFPGPKANHVHRNAETDTQHRLDANNPRYTTSPDKGETRTHPLHGWHARFQMEIVELVVGAPALYAAFCGSAPLSSPSLTSKIEKGETVSLQRKHTPRRWYPTQGIVLVQAGSYITESLFSVSPAASGILETLIEEEVMQGANGGCNYVHLQ